MIKKLVIALLCFPLIGSAQTTTHNAVASQFNNWRVYGSVNLAASANPLVAFTPCQLSAGGYTFNALSASTPIKIYDPGNPSVDEVVTPTSIVVNSNGCTATITPSNAHTTPWYISSGTFGLQEAINANVLSGQMLTVSLDSTWHAAGGGASTWYSAVGNATTALIDVTMAPTVTLKWNGTHYVPTYSLNGLSASIAVGAAAGTSPTVSNNTGGSGNLITANVTTGTATTTGTLFTETVTASAGNLNCTIQSVGANNFPVPISYTSTTTVATFTVATAPTASMAYIFNIQCE